MIMSPVSFGTMYLNSMNNNRKRRGEYGFDGNVAGVLAMTAVMVTATLAAVWLTRSGQLLGAVAAAVVAASLALTLVIYLHTTRRGKFLVWSELLDTLGLRGDERVLDVGCGRGAVLTLAAERLTNGAAVGIDLWSRADQSGNGEDAATRNLTKEGVQAHCKLVTGDMRAMPFADGAFDLAVSSLAIHNILSAHERARAIEEIARVVAPGGRVALVDLAWTRTYARRLQALGFVDVKRRGLGWRFWWGPAFPATALVTGTKPR